MTNLHLSISVDKLRLHSNGKERKYIQTKNTSLIMQVPIEAIYNAVQTTIYSLILYSMTGFDWKATSFFWFYYYILICFMYFTLYGMMIVALTPGHQVAAICMSFFLSFWIIVLWLYHS
ncbi:hypothetical protein AAZV13_03G153200 [Glycine max]